MSKNYKSYASNMEKKIFNLAFALFLSLGFCIAQEQSGFYATNTIEDVRIEFEQDNWSYLLDSLRYNGEELLLADISINGNKYESVGVRYEEGRGFLPGRKRNSLYVQLDFIKKSQSHEGYRSLFFSNALRDPSMVREVLAYEIARSYMPAPQANFAKIQVNDAYYGLLVNVETVEAGFLEKHFGTYTGDLFKSELQLEEKAPEGCSRAKAAALETERDIKCLKANFRGTGNSNWGDLVDLTLSLETGNFREKLDVDAALWMLAFNNVLVNLDSYTGNFSNNYYLYRDENGRFTPILGKLNFAFGSYKNIGIGSDLNLSQLITLAPLLHADNPGKPLIYRLLNDEVLQKIYLSHIRTIMSEHFVSGSYAKRVNELQKLIEKDRLADADNRYTSDEFYRNVNQTVGVNSQIPGIVELMDKRANFLRKHPAMLIIPPAITDIKLARRKRFSSEQIKTFKIQAKIGEFAKEVWLYYRFKEGGPFRAVEMKDDGESDDALAGDEIYGVEVVPDQGVRFLYYYIMAENIKAIRFDPPRYIYKQHQADLAELNQ